MTPALAAQVWRLPPDMAVKDAGPRTYRFTVEYETSNSRGEIVLRQRITGDYTRGLPAGEVEWKNVSQAEAAGPAGPFGTPEKRAFMEGFRYPNDIASTFKPEFFRGFPPTAVFERNLVWDTGMLESFGQQYLDRLQLNEPYHTSSQQDLTLPGIGTFQNRDIVLEWIGRSQRNGQACALIQYQAFHNPLEITNPGMTLKGSSNYWGLIWVSLATGQIEYATINEQVVGDLKLASRDTVQVLNVFRSGDFVPLSGE
jgi:hypothetical protein